MEGNPMGRRKSFKPQKVVNGARKNDIKSLPQFKPINELKAYIKDNNISPNIKEKQLQAVALYLWDKKRAKGGEVNLKIEITQKEKCPVCGMFVYKYPKSACTDSI